MNSRAKTIAAISTAFSNAAVGLVRLSGPDAAAIAEQAFQPLSGKALAAYPPRTAVTGKVRDAQGRVLDVAVATVFHAPASYTGENIAEFSCHGGTVVLSQVLARLISLGAVPAQRGEFTLRAFLNGKMDLTQCEAVLDIINAKTPLSARQAFLQSGGALRRKIEGIRNQLLDIDASIMVYVDYAGEGIDAPPAAELNQALGEVHGLLAALCKSYDTGKLIREGIDAALCGRPNVGKSSVMNLLCGKEKSIVTEHPGTTRDVVESTVTIGGLAVNLGDTAGIRQTEHTIEQLGVQRAKAWARDAGVLLCVFDISEPLSNDDREILSLAEGKPAVAIMNKCDLPAQADVDVVQNAFPRVVFFSAKTGDGLEKLKDAIFETASSAVIDPDGLYLTNLRQYTSLLAADEALLRAMNALSSGIPAEVAEADILESLRHLGEVTGQAVADDLIERIFENFCVGK